MIHIYAPFAFCLPALICCIRGKRAPSQKGGM